MTKLPKYLVKYYKKEEFLKYLILVPRKNDAFSGLCPNGNKEPTDHVPEQSFQGRPTLEMYFHTLYSFFQIV